LRVLQPPVGFESLNGQRKLDACTDLSVGRKYCGYDRAHLLEVGAGSGNLVNEIFYTENVIFAECLLNDGVVGKWDALLVDLAVTTLVNKLTDGLDVWLARVTSNVCGYPQRIRLTHM